MQTSIFWYLKRVLLCLFIALNLGTMYGQKIKVKTQAKIPKRLQETSGLVSGTEHSVWTHNDSGGQPILYKLNREGEITRQVFVQNAQNIDWEDLATDYQGFVYIADIGNNQNKRKDLCIYKIVHPDSLKSDTIEADIITFSYENQKAFPPPKKVLNFDAEALIAYSDSLYIFTKNRTEPYSAYTYIYTLANQKGKQIASLQDSLYLPKTHKYRSWVTGATKHPNLDQVLLISHKKAWIIDHFRRSKKLISTKISGIYSQKEGVCFDLNGNVWITNETFKFLKAKLKYGYIKR